MKIRPATVSDAKTICNMVNYYAERGRMLHRSLESVYLALRDFLVAEENGQVLGCVAIGIFWSDLAEVKSMAVAANARGKGVGSRLLKAAVANARKLGIKELFCLTLEKEFFERHDFEVIDRERLPEKVWRECIYCPKTEACDEIAMMYRLDRKPSCVKAAPKANAAAGRKRSSRQ